MFARTPLLVVVALGGMVGLAAAQEQSALVSRIAFGSCAEQNRPQPVWDAVVRSQPDLFLFLGDNIYGDTEDMGVLWAKYQKLGGVPGYQELLKTCPVLATWDDHDYGVNDGGASYPKREESQRLFLKFFNEPADSPRWKRGGVYQSYYFGPDDKRVQVILLDTRYHRSPLKKRPNTPKGVGPYVPDTSDGLTMLGEEQWAWLAGELAKPARLRLLGSSIQVVPEDHGWEKWMNLPKERERLIQLIRDAKASGVVFLSGDRHLAELSVMDGGVGYPLYDLTSSGLNQASKGWRLHEVNRHRVATMNFGDNFGLVTIDWEQKDPLVSLQIRDVTGDIIIQQKLPLSVLQVGKLKPAAAASRPKLDSGEELTKELFERNLNRKVTLTFTVQGTGQSTKNNLVFLNSSADFQSGDNFTVVLKESARQQLKEAGTADLREYYRGKTITVTGVLSEFRGAQQLMVEEAGQIRVRE